MPRTSPERAWGHPLQIINDGRRRVLDIEDALQWCYRDELPKCRDEDGRYRSESAGISPMFRMVAFGARIDNWSREPGHPLAMGEPHPDALIIADAVAGLLPEQIDITGYARRWGSDPIRVDVEVIAEQAARSVVGLVMTRARMGVRPDHGADPEVERVLQNGSPVVYRKAQHTFLLPSGEAVTAERDEPVPSANKRGGYYPEGSFGKIKFNPGRVAVFLERAEYSAWRRALEILAEQLAGKLASIEVRAPAAARRPWQGDSDSVRTGVVLRDSPADLRLRDEQHTVLAFRLLQEEEMEERRRHQARLRARERRQRQRQPTHAAA